MANNYSSGTIETNFNEVEIEIFLTSSGQHMADQFDEPYDPEEHTSFLHLHSDLWNMLDFDVEAAEIGIQAVFKAFPEKDFEAKVSVAFYCDKPRMGEFGGFQHDFVQKHNPVDAEGGNN